MLKIIPGATGYFNKTLNSNQFDNEDAIKDKLDNRGSIKGKLNNIYGKSIDYAALRHRDIIIAKIAATSRYPPSPSGFGVKRPLKGSIKSLEVR